MPSLNYPEVRVWWIPQVPGQPFYVPVKSTEEAILILDTLAKYDLFQLAQNIKPDYSNAGGLQVLETDGWTEWYNHEGNDIDDLMGTRQ